MLNPWIAAFIAAFVPGLYWVTLGAVGFVEGHRGFLEMWIYYLYTFFPVVLLVWAPLVLVMSRWFRPTLPNILSLSVAFWFCYQFFWHMWAATSYSDSSYVAVSGEGAIIYLILGIIFGYVYWFLAYREKRT